MKFIQMNIVFSLAKLNGMDLVDIIITTDYVLHQIIHYWTYKTTYINMESRTIEYQHCKH